MQVQELYERIGGERVLRKFVDAGSQVPNSRILWKTDEELSLAAPNLGLNGIYLSNIRYEPTVAIGGTCLLATGDLECILKGNLPSGEKIDKTKTVESISGWMRANLPRMDQIRDSVAALNIDRYAVVFEDSFFAELVTKQFELSTTERKELQSTFQELGMKCLGMINNWLNYARGTPAQVSYVFSSSVENDLQSKVLEIAEKTGNAAFATVRKSAINTMYTQLWADILAKESAIGTQDSVICAEPMQHLAEVLWSERDGYRGAIQQYLKRNPWGIAGDNERFSAYGFLPCIVPSENGGSTFSRYRPATEVISAGNNQYLFERYNEELFPIYRSRLVADTLNYLYFDNEAMSDIYELNRVNETLIAKKRNAKQTSSNGNNGNLQDVLSRIKNDASEESREIGTRLKEKLTNCYRAVYGGDV